MSSSSAIMLNFTGVQGCPVALFSKLQIGLFVVFATVDDLTCVDDVDSGRRLRSPSITALIVPATSRSTLETVRFLQSMTLRHLRLHRGWLIDRFWFFISGFTHSAKYRSDFLSNLLTSPVFSIAGNRLMTVVAADGEIQQLDIFRANEVGVIDERIKIFTVGDSPVIK